MPRAATPLLSAARDEYLEIRARRGAGGSIGNWRSLLTRFVSFCGNCHVSSVTTTQVERFFYSRNGVVHGTRGKPVAKSTTARYRNDLKGFLTWCHRRGWNQYTGEYLCGDVVEKSTTANRDRFRMDRTEILDLQDAATDPRDRALVSFCSNTACRISEAIAMTVGDVSLDKDELYLTRVKTRRQHTVAMTSDLAGELRTWLTHYASVTDGPLKKTYRLFPPKYAPTFVKARVVHQQPGYRADKPLTNPRFIIRDIAERAGIELEPGDGWHTLRRSAARIFFDDCSADGWDRALRMTQAFLDHKSARTTEIYLGLDSERRDVDIALRGKSFITRGMHGTNVVPLNRKAG